jgi:hypothetical protein
VPLRVVVKCHDAHPFRGGWRAGWLLTLVALSMCRVANCRERGCKSPDSGPNVPVCGIIDAGTRAKEAA